MKDDETPQYFGVTKVKEEIKNFKKLFEKAKLHPLTHRAQANQIIPHDGPPSVVTITDFKFS